MKKIISICLILASSGCVSASVDVDQVCTSKEVVLPGVPNVPETGGIVRQSVPYNFSDIVSKIEDYGSVSIRNEVFSIGVESGNLDFLSYMKVDAITDRTYTVIDTAMERYHGNKNFALPILVSGDELISIMRGGEVTFDFTVAGMIPTTDTKMNTTICVGVSTDVQKSL